MSNVYEVKAAALVQAAAQKLKEKMKKPAYVDFVKSGPGRRRFPRIAISGSSGPPQFLGRFT